MLRIVVPRREIDHAGQVGGPLDGCHGGGAASSALAAPHALADAADTREDTSREAAPAESEDDSVINLLRQISGA